MTSADYDLHPRWQTHQSKLRYRKAAVLLAVCSCLLIAIFVAILRTPFVKPELQLFSIGHSWSFETSESPKGGSSAPVETSWIEIDSTHSIGAWTAQIDGQVHKQQPIVIGWHGRLAIDADKPGLRTLGDDHHSRSAKKSFRDVVASLKRVPCREILLVIDAVLPDRQKLEQFTSRASEDVVRDAIEAELVESPATPIAVIVNFSQPTESNPKSAGKPRNTSKLICDFHNRLASISKSGQTSTSHRISTNDLISLLDKSSAAASVRSIPWLLSSNWPLDSRAILLRPIASRLEPTIVSENAIEPSSQPKATNTVHSALLDLERRLSMRASPEEWREWQVKQSDEWRSTDEGEWITKLLSQPDVDAELFRLLVNNRLKSSQLAVEIDTVAWVEDWYRQAEDLRRMAERSWHDRVDSRWRTLAIDKAVASSKLYSECQVLLAKVAEEKSHFERFLLPVDASTIPGDQTESDRLKNEPWIHDATHWKTWIRLSEDKYELFKLEGLSRSPLETRRAWLESIYHQPSQSGKHQDGKIRSVGCRTYLRDSHRHEAVSNQLMRFGLSWYARNLAGHPELSELVLDEFEKCENRLATQSISSQEVVREIMDLQTWVELQWQRRFLAQIESTKSNSSPWTVAPSPAESNEPLARAARDRHRLAMVGANQTERQELSRGDRALASRLGYPPASIQALELDVPSSLDWTTQNPICFSIKVRHLQAGKPLTCSIEMDDSNHQVLLDGVSASWGRSISLPTSSEARDIACEVRLSPAHLRSPGPIRMVMHVEQGEFKSRECIDFGTVNLKTAALRIQPVQPVNAFSSKLATSQDSIWRCMPNRIQPGIMHFQNKLSQTESFNLRLFALEHVPKLIPVGGRESASIDRWFANGLATQLLATSFVSTLPPNADHRIAWVAAEPSQKNWPYKIGCFVVEATSSNGQTKELLPCYFERITPRSRVVPSVTVDSDKGIIAVMLKRSDDAEGAILPCCLEGFVRDQAHTVPVSSGRVEMSANDHQALLRLSIANCRNSKSLLELQLDGQPSSFVYAFQSQQSGPVDESTTLVGLKVDVKPTKRIPLWNEGQVEAVCSALISDGMVEPGRDRLSIGLDRTGDREIDPECEQIVLNPIQLQVDWRGVDAEGNAMLEATVDIPQIAIPVDTRWNQFASVVSTFQRSGERRLYSNECVIVLDREPPKVLHVTPFAKSRLSMLGPPLAIEIEVFDALSQTVWVAGGWSTTGQMEFVEGMEVLPARRQANGNWLLTLPTDKLPSGNNVLLIQARDAAGNSSPTSITTIELRSEKELETLEASKTTSVTVRAVFGKQPLNNIRLAIYPIQPESDDSKANSVAKPTYQGRTNQAGEFRTEFRTGKYRIEASGSVNGNRQSKTMNVEANASKPLETYTFRFDLRGQ